jgi:hypothetical protein
MKYQSIDSLNVVPFPMTKKEKLLRWADLVGKSRSYLRLLHALEYCSRTQLRQYTIPAQSAFGIAISDPIFQSAGLSVNATILEIMSFFEIDQKQLHGFSCDCGGEIDNLEQARRIARLAS